MSLRFTIIPINSSFIKVANDIKSKIKHIVEEVYIDTNYHLSFMSRIQKRKKENFNIITIDEDYNETKSIVVKYCEKGSKSYSCEVNEFIDIISSFDNENEEEDEDEDEDDSECTENTDTNENESNSTEGIKNDCVIM